MKINKILKVAMITTSLATGFCHAETVSVEATVCDEEGGPVNEWNGPEVVVSLGNSAVFSYRLSNTLKFVVTRED